MALTPFLFRDILSDDYSRPHRLLDQHFGDILPFEDLATPFTSYRPLSRHYYRPWQSVLSHLDQGSTVKHEKDKFEVNVDVQQFSPQEITVKTTDDGIVVEGKHEEKRDEHGFVSRHFVRRYALPAGHRAQDVVSSLSSDGVLTITAPKHAIEQQSQRVVPITHTGPTKSVTEKKESK